MPVNRRRVVGADRLTAHAFDIGQRLVPEVGVVEQRVVAAGKHELLVGAFLEDPAVVENEDPVGVLDGPQPVGDDHRSAAAQQLPQPFLNLDLGERVHARSGFI